MVRQRTVPVTACSLSALTALPHQWKPAVANALERGTQGGTSGNLAPTEKLQDVRLSKIRADAKQGKPWGSRQLTPRFEANTLCACVLHIQLGRAKHGALSLCYSYAFKAWFGLEGGHRY